MSNNKKVVGSFKGLKDLYSDKPVGLSEAPITFADTSSQAVNEIQARGRTKRSKQNESQKESS